MSKTKFSSLLGASAFLHPTQPSEWGSLREKAVQKALSMGCDYETLAEVPIDWSTDQDSNSHVATATYPQYATVSSLRFIESFEASIGRDRVIAMQKGRNDIAQVVKDMNVSFKRAASYPDTILIGVRLTDLKQDRYRPVFTLFSIREQVVVAEITCWMVFIQVDTGKPINLLEADVQYRALYAQLEQQLARSRKLWAEWQRGQDGRAGKSRL